MSGQRSYRSNLNIEFGRVNLHSFETSVLQKYDIVQHSSHLLAMLFLPPQNDFLRKNKVKEKEKEREKTGSSVHQEKNANVHQKRREGAQ